MRGVWVGGVEGVGSGIPKMVGSTRNRGNYAELKKAHRGERQQKQGRGIRTEGYQGHPTVCFGENRLRFLDLIAVKARDFFNKTSRWTFVTRGVGSSLIVFGGTNMSFRVQNKIN